MSPARIKLCTLVSLVCLFVAPVFGQPATQPASDAIATITFAVPGSKPDTRSKAIVALPADYAQPSAAKVRWPVVYLLHGYSGNQDDWLNHTQNTDRALPLLATRYGVILVMPDGKYNTWYMDSVSGAPASADFQWETVITRHLVPEIDRQYRTWAEPTGRGITGLSMGGHGAIYLAARHPELFAACGSMSGALDLRPLKGKYELPKRLGPYEQNSQLYLEHSAVTQAEKFAGRQVGLLIECGLDDGAFIGTNQALHRRLLELKVPHDYIERPGGHSWPYWINALPYHLQFMSDRLKKAQ